HTSRYRVRAAHDVPLQKIVRFFATETSQSFSQVESDRMLAVSDPPTCWRPLRNRRPIARLRDRMLSAEKMVVSATAVWLKNSQRDAFRMCHDSRPVGGFGATLSRIRVTFKVTPYIFFAWSAAAIGTLDALELVSRSQQAAVRDTR